jgi:N-methylhydantoinase A
MASIVGIDIGGTFTDGVFTDDDGQVRLFKSSSTPSEPEVGLFNCVELAARDDAESVSDFLTDTDKFTYGTTITTNILVEENGAKTGLVTTAGFGDVLPISRIGRHHLDADVKLDRPDSLIPPSRIREVPERIGPDGEEIVPLDLETAKSVVDDLIENQDCDALAVAFLWSFQNPEHEREVAEYARSAYDIDVTTSEEIAPMQGEYERSATAGLNAYLRPAFRRHITDLDQELSEHGYEYPLMVMQSTGGLMKASEAADRPISTLFSGPAGAIAASQLIGDQIGNDDLINIDMGGTSFDVSVITDGEYETNKTARAGGHTVLAPQIDIHSIGAGGGSIAWLDKNRIRVGPRSAGADPGPICYDRGGTEPTVTDADLLLGYINPDNFVGGRLELNLEKTEQLIDEKLAKPLGMSPTEAAAGVRRIVDANMADAIRVLTVEKGHDPRNYSIVACGGAGPVHATALAAELGVGEVVVPYTASVHSALGILSSDLVYRLTTTSVTDLDEIETLNDEFERLADRGVGTLVEQGVDQDDIRLEYSADMRFRGQTHELELSIPDIPLTEDSAADLHDQFVEKYESHYGHGSIYGEADIELVSLVVNVIAETEKPSFPEREMTDEISEEANQGTRQAYFDGEFVDTAVYDGESLRPGNTIQGPAIIERTGTTIVVQSDSTASMDAYKNIHISMEGDQ